MSKKSHTLNKTAIIADVVNKNGDLVDPAVLEGFLASMKKPPTPEWHVKQLVEVWSRGDDGPKLGVVTRKERALRVSPAYDQPGHEWEYTVLVDGFLFKYRGDRIFDIGKSTAPPADFFPAIKRNHASLIANDLVSVQPMTPPSNIYFYLSEERNDQSIKSAAGNPARSSPTIREEERGLWGRFCGLWDRWRDGALGRQASALYQCVRDWYQSS